MIFLLLLVVFTYVLHKMCAEKGIAPFKHLFGFIAGFFLILFATSFVLVMVYGQNIINDPDVEKKVMTFAPFAMLFQFLLFVFFRIKIARVPVRNQSENAPPNFPPSNGKDDFSYFR